MAKNYPENYDHLRNLMGKLGKAIPGPMGGFSQLHKAAVAEGALDVKTKEGKYDGYRQKWCCVAVGKAKRPSPRAGGGRT